MSRFAWMGCLIVLLIRPASAGIHSFDHYSIAEGLPQTQVLASYQDAEGFLWFGTYGGISRYNGRDFQTYTTEHGLSANAVQAVTADHQGRLWVGTGGGACFLARQENRFHCLEHPDLDAVYVYALLAESDRLWLGTNIGLFGYDVDSGELQHYRAGPGVSSESVRSLARHPDGRLMLGTLDGLSVLNKSAGHWQRVELPVSQLVGVRALAVQGQRLWVGSSRGLFIMEGGRIERPAAVPEGFLEADVSDIFVAGEDGVWVASELGALHWQAHQVEWLGALNGLPDINLHSILVDAEGMVWMGHDDGLSKRIPGPFIGYNIDTGLLQNFVRSIQEDSRGRLWLGTRNGVQVVEPSDGGWDMSRGFRILREHGLTEPRIFSIGFPGPGEALLGTADGLMLWREGEGLVRRFDETDGLPNARVLSIFHDSQQRTWIGTIEGLALYEDERILPAPAALEDLRYPIRIQEDTRQRLWVATHDSGAWRLDVSGEVKRLDADHGLTNATLWDLAADDQAGMWLASNGDGLFHVNANDQVRRYTVDDGLVDNFGWQVLHDSQGRVWVYTNRGLARYEDGAFRTFGMQDGLLHLEGGATSALESRSGELWFGAAAGLMRYDPQREFFNRRPPPLVLESVLHEGQPLPQHSVLPNQPGSLDFQFAALSFHSEPAIRYQYRILGVSDRWSDPMPYRPITLAGLGGGDYVFEVRAMNAHGVWSEQPLQFAFSVRPAFWASWLFWIFALPMTLLLFWGGMHWRLAAAAARRRELEQLVAERTRELEQANIQLQAATITDPLTGLKNRRFLVSQIATDVAQTLRAYQGVSVFPNRDIVFMMIDLDHFKEINDTYGHSAGDRVLKQFADLIHEELRESDYVVRWGGEEFLVVARQTEASRCQVMVDRIVKRCSNQPFDIDGAGRTIQCTCSVGVSHLPFNPRQPKALSWEQVIDLADVAVYLAKARGRNGWVALRGVDDQPIGDGAAFMRRVKTDLDALIAEGRVVLESSE